LSFCTSSFFTSFRTVFKGDKFSPHYWYKHSWIFIVFLKMEKKGFTLTFF